MAAEFANEQCLLMAVEELPLTILERTSKDTSSPRASKTTATATNTSRLLTHNQDTEFQSFPHSDQSVVLMPNAV